MVGKNLSFQTPTLPVPGLGTAVRVGISIARHYICCCQGAPTPEKNIDIGHRERKHSKGEMVGSQEAREEYREIIKGSEGLRWSINVWYRYPTQLCGSS